MRSDKGINVEFVDVSIGQYSKHRPLDSLTGNSAGEQGFEAYWASIPGAEQDVSLLGATVKMAARAGFIAGWRVSLASPPVDSALFEDEDPKGIAKGY